MHVKLVRNQYYYHFRQAPAKLTQGTGKQTTTYLPSKLFIFITLTPNHTGADHTIDLELVLNQVVFGHTRVHFQRVFTSITWHNDHAY